MLEKVTVAELPSVMFAKAVYVGLGTLGLL